MKIISLFTTMAALMAFIGCKPKANTSHVSFVIGNNDIHQLTSANESQIPERIRKASVLIATVYKSGNSQKVKFGSGTLIGGNRVISNHHVFAVPDETGKATSEVLPQACSSTKILFGFDQTKNEPEDTVECQEGSLKTDFHGDLAVLTLKREPIINVEPLTITTNDVANSNDPLFVVHYPNIDSHQSFGSGIGTSLPQASITVNDCSVINTFENIRWQDPTINLSMRHTCDLLDGSSGSALVSQKTGEIVGVNWGGVEIKKSNGQSETVNAATRPGYVNAFLNNSHDDYFERILSQASNQSYSAFTNENQDSNDIGGCGSLAGGSHHPFGGVLFLLLGLLLPTITLAPLTTSKNK